MVNTEIRLTIFFAAEDGEALYSQQKQDRELTVVQILIVIFILKLKKVGKTTRPFRYDLNQISYIYTVEVTNKFKESDLIDRVPEELWTEVRDIVQEAMIKTNTKEKVSFHSNPKGNANECSNYCTTALISHTSKVMLKIVQAKLQQYVNRVLPDVQAGFRKGRGTKDQIANIRWITEKAREFQKTSTSALLTTPKLLTMLLCGLQPTVENF